MRVTEQHVAKAAIVVACLLLATTVGIGVRAGLHAADEDPGEDRGERPGVEATRHL